MKTWISKIPLSGRILLILIIFGMIRSPFEARLRREMTDSGMLLPVLGHSAVSNLTQSALMGTLGGLRSMIATFFFLESFQRFENDDWDGNKKALLMAIYLEPGQESHWVNLAWNRGINATAWLEHRSGLPDFEKKLRFQEYVLDAIELGRSGLKQLPASVAIRRQIADIYDIKLRDHCGAAQMYKEMIPLRGAPSFASRFYGYHLAQCPGQERTAYDHLHRLYWETVRNHLPSLYKHLKQLEIKLDIPYPLRISEFDPDLLSDQGFSRLRIRSGLRTVERWRRRF